MAVNHREGVSPQIFIIKYKLLPMRFFDVSSLYNNVSFNRRIEVHRRGIEVSEVNMVHNHLKCFTVSPCNYQSLETHSHALIRSDIRMEGENYSLTPQVDFVYLKRDGKGPCSSCRAKGHESARQRRSTSKG